MNTLRILLAVLVVTLGAGNGRAASFTAPITGTGGLSGTVTGSYGFASPLVLSGTNVSLPVPPTNRVMVMSSVASQITNAFKRFYYETNVAPSLSNLVAAASSGDVIELGAGNFYIGTQSIRPPAGVTLKGQGIGQTVILFDVGMNVTNSGVQLMSDCIYSDMTIRANKKDSYYQLPMGSSSVHGNTPCTNVVLRNLELDGDTDCIVVIQSDYTSGKVYNCYFHSSGDVFNLTSDQTPVGDPGETTPGSLWQFYETVFFADAATIQDPSWGANPTANAFQLNNGWVEFYNCSLIATNHKASAFRFQGTDTNRVVFFNTVLSASGTNGWGYEILDDTGATVLDGQLIRAEFYNTPINPADINSDKVMTFKEITASDLFSTDDIFAVDGIFGRTLTITNGIQADSASIGDLTATTSAILPATAADSIDVTGAITGDSITIANDAIVRDGLFSRTATITNELQAQTVNTTDLNATGASVLADAVVSGTFIFTDGNEALGKVLGDTDGAGTIGWVADAGGSGSGTNNPILLSGPTLAIIADQTARIQWATNQSFAFTITGSSNQSTIARMNFENLSTNTIYASNTFGLYAQRDGSNVTAFPIPPLSILGLTAELDRSNRWVTAMDVKEYAWEGDGTTITTTTNHTTGKVIATASAATATTNLTSINVTNVIRYGQVNLIATNTDPIHIDFALGNLFSLKLLTNASVVFTNVYAGLMDGRVVVQQDTNGQRTVDWSVAGGLIQTNASLQPTTNANAIDILEVMANPIFSTNLLAWWPQNFQPRVAFTNSLYADAEATYPLDLIPDDIDGAYSFALRLTTNWSSSEIAIVSRSSDGATNGITWQGATNNLSSLLSWAGSDSVFLVQCHDQSGNGRHLTVPVNTNNSYMVVSNGVPVWNGTLLGARRVHSTNYMVATLTHSTPVSTIWLGTHFARTSQNVFASGGSTTRYSQRQSSSDTTPFYSLNSSSSLTGLTSSLNQVDVFSAKFITTSSAAMRVDNSSWVTGNAGGNTGTSIRVGDNGASAQVIWSAFVFYNSEVSDANMDTVTDELLIRAGETP